MLFLRDSLWIVSLNVFNTLNTELNNFIETSKQICYSFISKKQMDSFLPASIRTSQSWNHFFVVNQMVTTLPRILPIFYQNKYVICFNYKAELLNRPFSISEHWSTTEAKFLPFPAKQLDQFQASCLRTVFIYIYIKHNIIWLNPSYPPYRKSLKGNIGKYFLRLINKNFPSWHKLDKIFNKSTLKLS